MDNNSVEVYCRIEHELDTEGELTYFQAMHPRADTGEKISFRVAVHVAEAKRLRILCQDAERVFIQGYLAGPHVVAEYVGVELYDSSIDESRYIQL